MPSGLCCFNDTFLFRYVFQILQQTKEIMKALPSLVDITVPEGEGKHLTVCGDVHGQVSSTFF